MATSSPRGATQADRATALLENVINEGRRSGELRLPRETELSDQLGLSRNTLREALARLAARGLIERHRRLGTFIVADSTGGAFSQRPPLAYPIDEIVTLPGFFADAGESSSVRSVSVVTEVASAGVAARLNIKEGAQIYRVRRVFAIDDRGAAVGEHVLPVEIAGHGVHVDALTDGISTFLKDVEHITVDSVRHTVTAIAADASISHDLHVPIGSPVLSISAELCAGEPDELRMVALGQLVFNPAVMSAGAVARSSS